MPGRVYPDAEAPARGRSSGPARATASLSLLLAQIHIEDAGLGDALPEGVGAGGQRGLVATVLEEEAGVAPGRGMGAANHRVRRRPPRARGYQLPRGRQAAEPSSIAYAFPCFRATRSAARDAAQLSGLMSARKPWPTTNPTSSWT